MHPRILAAVALCAAFQTVAVAQTFAPVVRASIKDSPRDGVGDAFNANPFEGLLRQTSSTEDRAIQEFDLSALSGAAIQSATLSGQVAVNNAFDNGLRTFEFSLYAGNGVADLSDFQISSTVVGAGQYAPPAQSSFSYSIDVTGALSALLAGGATFVGLKVDCTSEPNFPNILDGTNSQLVVVAAACGNVATFCTPGTTSIGCLASMSATGAPDANAGSGFVIQANNVDGQRQGLIFYGVDNSGFSPLPWGLSSSFLCVKPPTQRLPVGTSGGTAGACDGVLSADFNSFMLANPSALGGPFLGGEQVYAQAWFRDPPSPKSTSLSDALSFVVCP